MINLFKKRKKEPDDKNELSQLDRDKAYTELIKLHQAHSEYNFSFKLIFQYVFAILAVVLILVLTAAIILFVIFFKKFSLQGAEAVGTLISSFVAYTGSLIGILYIVLNYIFNKDDSKANNDLVSSVLTHDNNMSVCSPESAPSLKKDLDELSESICAEKNDNSPVEKENKK